jgi:hypothetical protein
MLQRSATGDQLDNENDQRDHEQKMNVSAENVEPDKTQKPKNQQNNKDGPKHIKTFCLRLFKYGSFRRWQLRLPKIAPRRDLLMAGFL